MDKILDDKPMELEIDTISECDKDVECLLSCDSSWVIEENLNIAGVELIPSYWSSHSNIKEVIKVEDLQEAEEESDKYSKCDSDLHAGKWPSMPVTKSEDILNDNTISKDVNDDSYPAKLLNTRTNFSSSESCLISNEYFGTKKRKFQCVKCKLNFDTFNSLQLHINSPLPCIDTATHTLPSKSYHSDKTLPAKKDYRCEICDLYFSHVRDLDSHLIVHSIEHSRFRKKDADLNMSKGSHLEMLQAISDKPFICHICGKGFSDNTNLQMHILLHNGFVPFLCKTCNQSFSDETLLEKHKLSHIGEKSSISQKTNSSGNKWTHTPDKPFKCLTCGKEFAHRYYLTNHERIHKGENPFVCEICYKRFSLNSELEKHSLVHEKPYVCELCYKRFSFSSELHQHTLVEHSVKKPFTCEICNQGFFRRDTLKIHKITHGSDSLNGDDLNEINCEEDSLICDVCGKEFASFATLHAHERNHDRPRLKIYKCTICTKSFVKRCDLKRHLMTHTGERPYECETCHKAFTRNSHLKTHKMLHTGEKPFKCLICNRGYTKRSDMRRHFKNHSANKVAKPEIIVL